MRRLQKYRLLTAFLLVVSTIPAQSRLYGEHISWESRDQATSVYLMAGITRGKANELVYAQPTDGYPVDYKLSQLVWDTRELPVMIAGFTHRRGSIAINLEGKKQLSDGNAIMDDYDWIYVNQDWTHWSYHDDTDLTEYWQWDINLNVDLWSDATRRLMLVAGYKQDRWGWESRGGSYIYSDTSSGGFRDLGGTFPPGQHIVGYEQLFRLPYLGLGFSGRVDQWRFHSRLIYSNKVYVETVDYHYLRDLIFEDNFSDGEMWACELGMEYQMQEGLSLLARFEMQDYSEVRGNTIYRDFNTGAILGQCQNCAGADNRNQTLSMGLNYLF